MLAPVALFGPLEFLRAALAPEGLARLVVVVPLMQFLLLLGPGATRRRRLDGEDVL